MPVLIKMMKEEELIKMQTHAVSTVINFVNGLQSQDDDEEQDESNNGDLIIKQYSEELFGTLV